MLKIENDLSDMSPDSKINSLEESDTRQIEELQNIKLRKKLEVFKEHLPDIHPFVSETNNEEHHHSHNFGRIDLATIMKKKSEQSSNQNPDE